MVPINLPGLVKTNPPEDHGLLLDVAQESERRTGIVKAEILRLDEIHRTSKPFEGPGDLFRGLLFWRSTEQSFQTTDHLSEPGMVLRLPVDELSDGLFLYNRVHRALSRR